jgi:hypothetical protein
MFAYMHFWAIPAGLAALSVPFIIHWLTKPRPVRVPLSTVRFVEEVVKQRRSRNRLRDLLILLARAAAVMLLALTIARPLFGKFQVNADSQAQTTKIVLLDVSQSMAAVSNGIQAMERARPMAARHVEYRTGTQANLILCGAAPRPVFDRPSTNLAALVDEVSRATPLPQRAQVQSALNIAAEMLSHANGPAHKRELIIISDFQRSNWVAADFSVLPVDTEIQLESVAPQETPTNLGIARVGAQGRVEQGRPFRLEVEVGNFGPSPRPVTVEATIGEAQYQLQGTCAAGGNTTLVAEITLQNPGWQMGEARLVSIDDGLAADNHRAIVLQVHPQPKYLLLTRQPTEGRATSSYYLERAMAPRSASERNRSDTITRADPTKVERDALVSADLVILDHPGKLADETIELLSGLMQRGRGVLYVAAEPIDATNLKLLAKAAGTSLQLPVEFSPPAAGQIRRNLFLTDVKRRQVPFQIFGEEASAITAPLRFGGGLTTRRVEGALLDDVAATYNDQSVCLVVSACGAGALTVLNADLGASNLPASPAFVPMIGELVGHLQGRDRSQETVYSGEPLAVFLPAAAIPMAGLQIVPPVGGDIEPGSLGELHEEPVGVMWQAASAGPPGAYSVRRGSDTVFALASAISAEESDLMPLSPDLMTNRLAGGRAVEFRSAFDTEDPRDDLWSKLAIGCLLCVFAEFACLIGFRC